MKTADDASPDRATMVRVIQQLVAVMFFWGANVVVLKYLTAYFDPLALVTLRLIVSATVILPVVFMRYGFVRLSLGGCVSVGAVALFSFIIHQAAMTWGIARTSATHGVLILGLMPLATMLLASALLKEKLSRAKLIGVALGFAGIALIALAKNGAQGETLLGDGLLFLAVVTYSIGSIYVKKSTAHATPLVITAYSLAVSAVVTLALTLANGGEWTRSAEAFHWGPIAGLLFVGWFSTALGTLWWNTGIHHLGASTTSLFFNGVPVVGVAASVVFLGEHLVLSHYLALCLVLAGISLGSGIGRASPR